MNYINNYFLKQNKYISKNKHFSEKKIVGFSLQIIYH